MSFNPANYVIGASSNAAFWNEHNEAVNCSYAAINDPSVLLPGSTTLTTHSSYGTDIYYPGSTTTPWVINPQPIIWPPTTTVSPGDLVDKLSEQESEETLEETIQAVQDQALYDVQTGNLTEEQFFEVMKMTFAMLKLLPKKPKEEGDEEDE